MSVTLSTAQYPLVSPELGDASGVWPVFSRITLPTVRAIVDDDDDADEEKEEVDDDDAVLPVETEPLPIEEDDYFDENDFDDDFDDDFEEEYEEIEADFNEDEDKLPDPPKIEEEPDLDGDF